MSMLLFLLVCVVVVTVIVVEFAVVIFDVAVHDAVVVVGGVSVIVLLMWVQKTIKLFVVFAFNFC